MFRVIKIIKLEYRRYKYENKNNKKWYWFEPVDCHKD